MLLHTSPETISNCVWTCLVNVCIAYWKRLMQTDNFQFQGSLQMCVGGADAKSRATKVTSNGSIDVAFLDLLCTADIVILLCIGL